MMDRDEQIRLMDSVEERHAGYVRKWLAKPEVRAALQRYDSQCERGVVGRDLRQAYCG